MQTQPTSSPSTSKPSTHPTLSSKVMPPSHPPASYDSPKSKATANPRRPLWAAPSTPPPSKSGTAPPATSPASPPPSPSISSLPTNQTPPTALPLLSSPSALSPNPTAVF